MWITKRTLLSSSFPKQTYKSEKWTHFRSTSLVNSEIHSFQRGEGRITECKEFNENKNLKFYLKQQGPPNNWGVLISKANKISIIQKEWETSSVPNRKF